MVFPQNTVVPGLSGERFRVLYHMTGTHAEVMDKAREVALEQTVELPGDIVPGGEVRDMIVGQIETVDEIGAELYAVTISYAVECAGDGLTQFLNVVYGNSSLQPGILVVRLDLPPAVLASFRGPRFGVDGLRALVGADARPLLCTALKPMGFTPAMLADLAYKLALGGLDIIKDDHGLANQPFCPFNERVERCAEAVAKANRETGLNCLYAPNVTAPHDALLERARFAKSAGAGAFLLSYGLTGIDGLRLLSTNDALGLPVIAHAALTGGFVVTPTVGISHYALYGQIVRLAGGDASIFVSYGGRFPYSEAQCRGVIEGCSVAMGHLRTIFPTPGGGMTIERLPELKAFYGRDVMFLIAGGLYRYSDDLVANARQFAQASRV